MCCMMCATSVSSTWPVSGMCDFKQFIEGCAARRVRKLRTAWCIAAAICGAVLPALRKRLTTPKRTTRLLPQAWNLTNKRQFLSSSKMAIASACLRNSRSSSRMVSAMHHSSDVDFLSDKARLVFLPRAASLHAASNSDAGGASIG